MKGDGDDITDLEMLEDDADTRSLRLTRSVKVYQPTSILRETLKNAAAGSGIR